MELKEALATPLTTLHQPKSLFNPGNWPYYNDAMQRGLALLSQRMRHTRKPWSGISAQALSPRVARIDLAEPLFSVDAALEELDTVYLQHAVYFHHPRYAAHLNCPIAYPALLGELISSAVNTSVDTWDQSAGATLIEQKLIDWTAELVGFEQEADGVFTSGGTQSNLMGLLLARDHFCRRCLNNHCVREQGLPDCASRFRVFCSGNSHFSIQKAAALTGLGYQAVVGIPVDSHYRMDTHLLRREIQHCRDNGLIPIAVVATAGTTDFGSIDPLTDIASVAQENQLWLHVDAAYGCGLLASQTQRQKLSGIELADSVTVDYHKSFLQPVACSAFLVRRGSDLGVLTHHAEYLNPLAAEREGTPNLVNKSLQTTRRFDALKLWMTLRILGANAIGDAFDSACERARSAFDLLRGDREFEVLHEPELSTLVFRFHPHKQPHLASNSRLDGEALDQLNDAIRKALLESGEAMVAGTRVNGRRYLKFTFLNPDTRLQDIRDIVSLIRAHGHALANIKAEAHHDAL